MNILHDFNPPPSPSNLSFVKLKFFVCISLVIISIYLFCLTYAKH